MHLFRRTHDVKAESLLGNAPRDDVQQNEASAAPTSHSSTAVSTDRSPVAVAPAAAALPERASSTPNGSAGSAGPSSASLCTEQMALMTEAEVRSQAVSLREKLIAVLNDDKRTVTADMVMDVAKDLQVSGKLKVALKLIISSLITMFVETIKKSAQFLATIFSIILVAAGFFTNFYARDSMKKCHACFPKCVAKHAHSQLTLFTLLPLLGGLYSVVETHFQKNAVLFGGALIMFVTSITLFLYEHKTMLEESEDRKKSVEQKLFEI